jgi:hypothetical protein
VDEREGVGLNANENMQSENVKVNNVNQKLNRE